MYLHAAPTPTKATIKERNTLVEAKSEYSMTVEAVVRQAGDQTNPSSTQLRADNETSTSLEAAPNLTRNSTNTSTRTSSTLSSSGGLDNSESQLLSVQVLEKESGCEEKPEARSHSSNEDSSRTGASATTGGQLSGQWGWFEDVHNDSGLSPKHTSEALNQKRKAHEQEIGAPPPEEKLPERGRGRTYSRRKNRGGLLQFSHSTVKPLNDVMPNDTEASAMAVSAPNYVLEESLSSQKLWKQTSGNRPPQPVEERAFFEKMWAENFLRSEVKYKMPAEVLMASSPISLSPFADGGFVDSSDGAGYVNYNIAGQFNANLFGGGGADKARNKATEVDVAEATLMHKRTESNASEQEVSPRQVKGSRKKIEGNLSVLVKGDNVFGTTVSKSFSRPDRPGRIDTISVSIASYRVVQSKKHGKYAQFLVVYREGSVQDMVGVWKRYSDFDALSRKVTAGEESCSDLLSGMHPLAVEQDNEKELLPNAITSWRLLKKRQRWYRCLDAGYLSLKVFLLERFLHDILFECTNPKILRDFVGVDFSQ